VTRRRGQGDEDEPGDDEQNAKITRAARGSRPEVMAQLTLWPAPTK
jgi:hypothetical protein